MFDSSEVTDLVSLTAWFGAYCRSFRSADPEVQRNFDLKELHTRKVCEAARLIAAEGGERRQMLAQVAALCHDLGRFPQYREYRTFLDSESVNHAHLSAQVLKQSSLLDFLPKEERDSVYFAVRLHNVFQIPAGLPAATEDLLRLVRDADKIDIWRVFIDYFFAPEGERASAAGLGFPDLPYCSDEVLKAVEAGRMVELTMLKSLNDFKLLQLSWVYDINFVTTHKLIKERSLVPQLAATLPDDAVVRGIVDRVQGYLEDRLAANSAT
ncbi:HD family phosphohydrolase [Geomonas silvestris]|uniref:HD family phosphohydrolase n=1 Tax=Geomonas silvestris TaxID=2740184 RepID=A0A6V8MPH1_9BACT|nr:HD domain-containing protein [Geomonas silvestris]GFO61787.1 HD family phosphohydrolase [Geomonas silvestris]